MRLTDLAVENLRAVNHMELHDLRDVVVIAGQNGAGKSCILDAIRLLKSVYGGYSDNEWHMWLGEFGIGVDSIDQLNTILRDRARPLRIHATMTLADSETEFISSHLKEVLEPAAWKAVTGRSIQEFGYSPTAMALAYPGQVAGVDAWIADRSPELTSALTHPAVELGLSFSAGGRIEVLNRASWLQPFLAFTIRRTLVLWSSIAPAYLPA